MAESIVELGRLTWPEVRERLKETDIAIIAAGSTEQHGFHLPVNNDTFVAYNLARRVADIVAEDVKAVVVPPIPYGFTGLAYPGCISLSMDTLISVYKEVAKSLIRGGFKKIIFVNGHGGNINPLERVVREITSETGAFVALVQYWQTGYETIMDKLETEGKVFGHAGEMETSVAWALGQEVRADKRTKDIRRVEVTGLKDYLYPPFRPKINIPMAFGRMRKTPETSTGVTGDATLASKVKGEVLLKPTVDAFVELLRRLKDLEVELKKFVPPGRSL